MPKPVADFFTIKNGNMKNRSIFAKDPGCCGDDSSCCGNITEWGCC
jgi:hypothetical protein